MCRRRADRWENASASVCEEVGCECVCVEWNLSRSITVSQSTSLVQYGGLMLWCLVQCPFGVFFYYQVTIFCNIFVNDQLVAKFKSSRFEFIYNQVQKN